MLPRFTGVRWWMAVALALALTSVGAFIDLQRLEQLGSAFYACYLLGCLLAVVVVQRKNLFGPMVQPPLVLAATVPVTVVLTDGIPDGGGTASTALAIGTPLINNFPVMAITTVLTLGVGFLRLANERPPAPQLPFLAQSGNEPDDPRPTSPNSAGPNSVRRTPSGYHPAQRDPAHGDAEPMTEPVPRVQDPPTPRQAPPQHAPPQQAPPRQAPQQQVPPQEMAPEPGLEPTTGPASPSDLPYAYETDDGYGGTRRYYD